MILLEDDIKKTEGYQGKRMAGPPSRHEWRTLWPGFGQGLDPFRFRSRDRLLDIPRIPDRAERDIRFMFDDLRYE